MYYLISKELPYLNSKPIISEYPLDANAATFPSLRFQNASFTILEPIAFEFYHFPLPASHCLE